MVFPCPRALRRRLGDERGFTLVELLVGTAAALLVFAATMSLLVVGGHKRQDVANRAADLDTARVSLDRLERELRTATSATVTNSGRTLTYVIPAGTVTWSCTTAGACTRALGSTTNSTVSVLNAGSATNPIFSAPTTNQVLIQFQVSSGRASFWITDAVNLRNVAATS